MPFEFWPAVLAGLLAGVAMEAMPMTMQVAGVGMKMDMLLTWGSMMGMHGTAGRILGFAVHEMLSVAVFLIYALGFDLIGADNNLWAWGLLGGAVHWAIAGMFMVMLPAMHPEIPGTQPAPGPFALYLGMPDAPGFLMGHLVYGVSGAILYALFHSAGGANLAF